jgi:hypothetical protein
MLKLFMLKFLISIAGAQAEPPPSMELTNPLKYGTIPDLINGILDFILLIGAPICALFILIGGFQLMTAGGNPESVTKGRKTITYAVVGYAIILVARGIGLVVENLLTP